MLNSFGDSIPPYITPILICSCYPFTSKAVCAYNHLIVLISSNEYPFFSSSLNSFGDSIPPYITPILIYSNFPFTSSAVYAYNHLIVLISSIEYPFFSSSLNSFLCGTESNAF